MSRILIVALTPYFLEKGFVWFQKNLNKILQARKTQSFFQDNTLYIEKDQQYNLSQFLRQLDEMGYEKVLQASEPGDFAHRGGVLDVFPINSDAAVRIEFLGNKIEKISELSSRVADEKKSKEILKKRLKSQKLFSDLKGLKPRDYLVHLDHGVSRFCGIGKFQITNYKPQPIFRWAGPRPALSAERAGRRLQNPKSQTQNYYLLEYAQGDKLYVPLGLERKLSRYIGFIEPKISRLGSQLWQKTKRKIKKETEKFARELLQIYAQRKVTQRSEYASENEIDFQLAASFPYEETPDQLEALKDIKNDLQKQVPMDRIVCGDVGFGKTEIALRTIIRAVNSGYQAALICPTTILAQQHFQNFKERLKNLPVKVALLSRLQTKKEQNKIAQELKSSQIDIVVGTHRILSKDIEFKNMGLLVVDEEQKFGVRQKEKLKKIRSSLDILSLSATPIPRTLHLALSSLKNISLVQTPPQGRLPVKTFIAPFSKETIKKAVESELARGGQVYYLHNRVETIGFAQKLLGNLVSKARLGIAHGRLGEKELLKVMKDFQQKKKDVLIATTIIENGLDLPNVNALIVADSTKLGLSQAYQIRGRIGRSHIQASAFFLYGSRLSEKASLRLKALKEAAELGSGYRLALRDLEIRGAGNILGREQSGSINRVGLNLYCQMLSETVERLKQT